MRLTVLGEPCIDYIHREGIVSSKHFGGILYSIVSLAVISHAEDEILPVMNTGEDEYDNITGFLKKFKNINTEHIKKVAHKTRVVNLYYKNSLQEADKSLCRVHKTYDREENSTDPTYPVEFEDAQKALNNSNALLINMVSGIDISLETLRKISKRFKGYIHLDLHNVVMKTLPDGQRIQDKVEKWKEWCTAPDTLQMNESELHIMTGEKLNEYNIAEKLLMEAGNTARIRALVVTSGKKGAAIYMKKEKTILNQTYFEIDKQEVASVERNNIKDTTGCGDVFASGFFYKNALNSHLNLFDSDFFYKNALNSNSSMFTSLNYANRLASINSSLEGVEGLSGLK